MILAFIKRQMPVLMVQMASHARIVEKRLGGQVVAAAAVRLDTVAITVGRQMPVRMVRMASRARTLVPPLVLLAAVSASAQMDTVAITVRRQTHE